MKSSGVSMPSSRRSRARKQNEECEADCGLGAGLRFSCEPAGACRAELQALRGSTKGLHEKLRGPGMLDRIQNLHEGLQEIVITGSGRRLRPPS